MFIDLARKRRSVRRYEPRPIEPEKIERLIEAALRAPSSRGLRPWEFIVVSNPQTIEQLAAAKPHGSSFLKGAALAVVVCVDPAKCDVWVEDAAIATIYVHLAAADMGLGSCWIQIREREHDGARSAAAYVGELLQLPPQYEVEAIVAVGYPAEEKKPHAADSLPYDKVHYEAYGRRV